MNADDFIRAGERMQKAGDSMASAGLALALVVFFAFLLAVLFL